MDPDAMTPFLALLVGGSVTLGVGVGLLAYHLALPQILARAGLSTVRAIWDETERHLIAKALRPRRAVRWGRWVGAQNGRHLT